ncbi:MAG: phosphatidylserine decarboxylase [Desulfomonile tiedjei]|uniref:Phosphatidylserine decarboxylase n=1 Tax=Desulfomonile tiedjei TaxID=2358 RepID=A0A9D6V5R0_9BACT|nr:phosphatidylserine decarboxylase [Desulfomonile tiedjei]
MKAIPHQYVERETGRICTEKLIGDKAIQLLYSVAREKAPLVFRALTSARISSLIASARYDSSVHDWTKVSMQRCGLDLSECIDSQKLNTARKIFERKIRYWEYRPMPEDNGSVVSPADARCIVGSLRKTSRLFIKDKFFSLEELVGTDKPKWIDAFLTADFAIFRLTPEKYHYNHTPVAGQVVDIYEIPGGYHSCNPGAVVTVVTPFSKNKRVVTVIDTDVQNGTGVGLVAMIEIVALMIGDIVQAYSETRYENPSHVTVGMFLNKGLPKSLYRPGSSTDVLLFQEGRIRFSEDLVRNMHLSGVHSRFSQGFGQPLVETDLKVRSIVGTGAMTQGDATAFDVAAG